MSKHGRFIVIEGTDGSGKTTLVSALVERLQSMGLEVDALREPGGTALSEHLRLILKGELEATAGADIHPRAEALLFAASRAQLVHERLLNSLAAGRWVVLDRFVLSSMVYQGIARGLGVGEVAAITDFATQGLRPDRVLFLEVDTEVALARQGGRDAGVGDRIDGSGGEFMRTVREGYQQLAAADPHITRINANGTPQEVLDQTLAALSDLLPRTLIA